MKQETTENIARKLSKKEKLKRGIAITWDHIKIPVAMTALFWFSGFGFYHGVVSASKIGELTLGKAMIVTVVDLEKND